jgi:polyferredoxin
VGIDIREGLQRECIACAGCIDACEGISVRRGVSPCIAYRGTIRHSKAYLLAGVTVAALFLFAAALLRKPPVSFSVQWEGRTADPAAHLYRYTFRSDLPEPLALTLTVEGPVRLVGGERITVPPRSRATGRVTVAADGPAPEEVRFTAEGAGVRLGRKAAFP